MKVKFNSQVCFTFGIVCVLCISVEPNLTKQNELKCKQCVNEPPSSGLWWHLSGRRGGAGRGWGWSLGQVALGRGGTIYEVNYQRKKQSGRPRGGLAIHPGQGAVGKKLKQANLIFSSCSPPCTPSPTNGRNPGSLNLHTLICSASE